MAIGDDVTVIHGILPGSEIQFKTVSNVLDCYTKIDKDRTLNVYHAPNFFLPFKHPGYWVAHDEIEELFKQGELNVLNFLRIKL
jgi:hypothetical protein